MPALDAAFDVPAEGVGSARANRAKNAQVAGGDSTTSRGAVLRFVSANDVGHLDGPTFHDDQMESAMASKGLFVRRALFVATRVYWLVVPKEAWPSRTWIVRMSMPASKR